jgi:cysteine desulfurase / selenocysteine lyase
MQPIGEKYREQFPVTKNLVYLNHAAVGPLCRPAADAMQRLAQDALEFGSVHYQDWMDTYQALRVAAARMINAAPGEIAIVKNTSEGIATVASGIQWRSGDIVVAFEEEFPANFYPWKRLEARGVHVRWLSVFDEPDRIDTACRGARMLAVSHVQYLSGYRVNLEAIGEICARHGCFFLVDAIQGLGAFPIDVRAAHIDALAADGHKWLLGPEGCGVLYVRQEVQDEIEPVEFGWTNVAKYYDYASRDMTLRPDAGRYECGTLNTIGCYGLRAAFEFLVDVGIDKTAPAVRSLGDRVWDGVTALGFETLGRRTPETGAGIVSFRKPGVDSRVIVSQLREAGIVTAPRQGWVRCAPHFYIAPDGIERMLAELKAF